MRRAMIWVRRIVLAVFGLAVIVFFVVRAQMPDILARQMFVTHSQANKTPADFGVPFTAVTLASGDHALQAIEVSAGPDTPAVLIFHGDSETVRDWAAVQAYLCRQGLSSMVFDYSGFGASGGKPTVEDLDADAPAAYASFARWAGPSRPKFVLGFSLGTAVLLHNAHAFAPAPAAIVTYGAFSSARNLVMYLGAPFYYEWLIPDMWDNVEDAQRLRRIPLLAVAGADDANVPPIMGRQVAIAADGQFKLVWDADHEDIHGPHFRNVWAPILDFLQARMSASHWTGPGIKPEQPAAPAEAR
jgi:uncharacterized protein